MKGPPLKTPGRSPAAAWKGPPHNRETEKNSGQTHSTVLLIISKSVDHRTRSSSALSQRAHRQLHRIRDPRNDPPRRTHGATNLAQGFPDFPAPEALKRAAAEAIDADINQYSITWGAKPFRDAIAAKYARHYAMEFDPEREITVCCGATEGMIAAMLAVIDPGDEVVIFEPFYENYNPDTQLCGATARYVTLRAPDWSFDRDELRRAFNAPHQSHHSQFARTIPPARFSRAKSWNSSPACARSSTRWPSPTRSTSTSSTMAPCTRPIISLPGMRERSILVNSMSKTYSVTGWRVGWVLAPPDLTDSIRKVHDFLTVGAASPLQQAGVMALGMPDDYYANLAAEYAGKRDHMVASLEAAGLRCSIPRGAYYVMADISKLGFP